MKFERMRVAVYCAATLFVISATPRACGADWWEDAEADEQGYRVVNYEDEFQNEGKTPDDCDWECNQSKATDWYIVESGVVDVKYKDGQGNYQHVQDNGEDEQGDGTKELTQVTQLGYKNGSGGVARAESFHYMAAPRLPGSRSLLGSFIPRWSSNSLSRWSGSATQRRRIG